jgi:hypothetical protein
MNMKRNRTRGAATSVSESSPYLLELASIFAQGVLRLHQQGHLPQNTDGLSLETALKTARQDLEQSRETRLSVTKV